MYINNRVIQNSNKTTYWIIISLNLTYLQKYTRGPVVYRSIVTDEAFSGLNTFKAIGSFIFRFLTIKISYIIRRFCYYLGINSSKVLYDFVHSNDGCARIVLEYLKDLLTFYFSIQEAVQVCIFYLKNVLLRQNYIFGFRIVYKGR